MYLKQTTLACLFALTSQGVLAQALTLKSDYPSQYQVRKGDTLWDISGKYLEQPWLWPRLWNINPQIANPHWIYPGDVLQLSWVNGEPRLGKMVQGGKRVLRLSPKNHYESKANPIPTLPLSEIGPFMQTDHIFTTQQESQGLPYILGENAGHIGMLEGATLYVQGALIPGQDYGIYRPGTVYRDKQTRELLGQEAIFVGTARAQASLPKDRSRILLTRSQREVYQGDRLMPLPAQEMLSALFVPRAAPVTTPGYVVELPSKARGGGKFDIVLINKGAREQMAPGDVLDVLRPGVRLTDKYGKVSYRELSSLYDKGFHSAGRAPLPDESIARIMLFKVYDKLSYGMILQSQDMVSTGYKVSHF